MFTQEQQSILSNIKSLVSELEQIDEGASTVEDSLAEEEKAQKSNKNNRRQVNPMSKDKSKVYKEEDGFIEDDVVAEDDEFSEEEVEKAIKAIRKIMKSDDGTTASDDAEERLEDDIDEETQDNVDEVTKALKIMIRSINKSNKKAIANRRPVQKSSADVDELKKAVLDLTKVVKSVAIDQKESTQAVENILSGLGVVKRIQKSNDSRRSDTSQVRKSAGDSAQNRPIAIRSSVQSRIANEVRKALGDVMPKSEERSISDRSVQREDVRKSLRSVMPDIFNVSK